MASDIQSRFAANRFALATFLLLTITQTHAIGTLEGQVIDQSTGKPIPGAIVVITWGALGGGVGGSTQFCLHVESATADDQGRYRMPDWHGWWGLEHGLLWNRTKEFVGYKAGYMPVMSPLPTEERIYLIPFSGTNDEWFGTTMANNPVDPDCRGPNADGAKNLYRLDAARAAEARTRAVTDQEKYWANRIDGWAEFDRVDWTKPIGNSTRMGLPMNEHPEDAYKAEELLK